MPECYQCGCAIPHGGAYRRDTREHFSVQTGGLFGPVAQGSRSLRVSLCEGCAREHDRGQAALVVLGLLIGGLVLGGLAFAAVAFPAPPGEAVTGPRGRPEQPVRVDYRLEKPPLLKQKPPETTPALPKQSPGQQGWRWREQEELRREWFRSRLPWNRL